jgi:hypothetical protein
MAFSLDKTTTVADMALLETLSARDRRVLAVRFLRSQQSMGELMLACNGSDPAALDARKVLASAVLMIKQDAPEDLAMTDPALYRRLRERITQLRMSGW